MNPRVRKVEPASDCKLLIELTNGEIGIYNCAPHLDFGLFKELKDVDYFNQAHMMEGTMAWLYGQNVCPDTLYLDSAKTEPGINCKVICGGLNRSTQRLAHR